MSHHSVPRALHRFTVAQKRARKEKIERLTEDLRRRSWDDVQETPQIDCGCRACGEALGNWLDHAK